MVNRYLCLHGFSSYLRSTNIDFSLVLGRGPVWEKNLDMSLWVAAHEWKIEMRKQIKNTNYHINSEELWL
jgi:hypothetical protein